MDFIPHTEEDKREMLEEIGVGTIDELFSDIPDEVQVEGELLGKDGKTEQELKNHVNKLARENEKPGDRVSLIGAGLYHHFIPSVVSHVTGRSEFYSAYTPYQAEISQGTLGWMFEFQTAISELTGMEIANASMYDGGSSAAEAVLMTREYTDRGSVVVADNINPYYREVIETYLPDPEDGIIELSSTDGRIDKDHLTRIIDNNEDLSGLVVQTPNYYGIVEDLRGLKDAIGDGFLIVSSNPISLGILQPPGEFDADIVVGEGQPLGNPVNFGGPLLGLFATKMDYLRYLPGRVSGKTEDSAGDEGFVMALQTREQHIRRERATSNICTNQALNALAATVYLSSLGPDGLAKLARINWNRAHYLADKLTGLNAVNLRWDKPFFNEFVIDIEADPEIIWEKMKEEGIDLLHPDHLRKQGLENDLMIAVTEQIDKDDMDRFVKLLDREL